MTQLTIQQAYDLAVQHHRAGRLQEAEVLYRQILTEEPRHAGALHHLGVIALNKGRSDIAADFIRQAIAIDPNYAEAYSNLGMVLKDAGRLDEAIAAYRRAIQIKPDLPEAHNNLGVALKDTGNIDEAMVAYRHAIVLRPNYPEACNSLGIALKVAGRLDEAVAAFRQSLVLRPDDGDVHNNLGLALRDKGQLDEAIAAHRMAIGLKPEFAEAQNDLGVALKDKGQLDEAIGAYRHAIALKPNFAEAHSNLGNALKDLGRLDEAVAAYRQAISLRPGFSIARSGLLYLLNFHTAYDAQAVAEETDRWNRQHAHPLRKFIQPHANDRSPDRRLRLGYVSADFCGHASALFIDPLLRHHDHQKFEVFCYAQMVRSDWVTRRMQTYADHWLDTRPWTDEQLAQHIRDDRIDILVDLKLHTADNRLLVFARKPAPIQVSWLGYPGSTGLETIDYRLTDPYLEPTGQTNLFPDRPYHLPNCFWCYDPMSQQPQVNSLPAIAAGHITFGSLNNFFKVTNATLDLWAKVLVAVPDSRLILLAPPGSARPRTVAYLSHRGVDPRRIEFVSRQSREEYLRTYHRIDIGLDTLPCNGHTTSMDSFWMSVPVVTLPGTAPSGRAGLSFARNLKLPDLVANDDDDFAKIAASLSADLPALAGLRASLRPLMEKSSLMDAEGFTRDIELAYRQMWRTWCETASAKS